MTYEHRISRAGSGVRLAMTLARTCEHVCVGVVVGLD